MLWAERVLAAGAGGYIMKFEATEKVIEAAARVLDGEVWVSEPHGEADACRSSRGGRRRRRPTARRSTA